MMIFFEPIAVLQRRYVAFSTPRYDMEAQRAIEADANVNA
jgi:hypothetical protein